MHRLTSLVPVAASLALGVLMLAAPVPANATDAVTWDHSTGMRLTPGVPVEVARMTMTEDPGLSCTLELEASNGQSQHPGNRLTLDHNGVRVLTIEGIEDQPFTVTSDSVTIESTGNDELVVSVESTQARRTSSAGLLSTDCATQATTTTTEPPGGSTTTTTEPPGGSTTTTTRPPGSTTTTQPPGGSSTTTQPPGASTSVPPADPGDPDAPSSPPPVGDTPVASGGHEEPAGEARTFLGLLAILGMVGSAAVWHLGRAER